MHGTRLALTDDCTYSGSWTYNTGDAALERHGYEWQCSPNEGVVKVYGIDPAPTKGLAVFDGRDQSIPINHSRSLIDHIQSEENVLVCWDAPLTGPPLTVTSGAEAYESAFSQRPIESFFSRRETGFKTPGGISVRSYSGCPHWALTRSLIGLPRTGRFDSNNIPFKLTVDDAQKPACGRHVVEVHPAVALWLWCRAARGTDASWEYKKQPAIRDELWKQLLAVESVAAILTGVCPAAPSSDDQLDARVAYVLGKLWLSDSSSILLVGNADTGTFLLPAVAGLESAFASFIRG